MLQTYSPVGKFIILSYQSPSVLDGDGLLQNKLEDIIALLKHKVQEKGIEYAQKNLEEQLFGFRFEILEYLLGHPEILEEFENTIIDQIGSNYFTKGKFKELGNVVSDTLEIYLSMFENLAREIKTSLPKIGPIPEVEKQKLTIGSFKHLYSLQPNPELFILIEWLSASVKYDFNLIVAEFIITKKIVVNEQQVKFLIRSIKQSIVDFGTYTTLSGLWQPKTEDESPLMRNIKIKTAATKLNLGISQRMNPKKLQSIINP